MAPPNNPSKRALPATSGGSKAIPEKIQCIRGEWIHKTGFSKRQLESYQNALLRGQTIRIPCRSHSGEPPSELKCEGPCGQVQALEAFSRHSRNKKRWCKKCTSWQITMEADRLPYHAPADKAWDREETRTAKREPGGDSLDNQFLHSGGVMSQATETTQSQHIGGGNGNSSSIASSTTNSRYLPRAQELGGRVGEQSISQAMGDLNLGSNNRSSQLSTNLQPTYSMGDPPNRHGNLHAGPPLPPHLSHITHEPRTGRRSAPHHLLPDMNDGNWGSYRTESAPTNVTSNTAVPTTRNRQQGVQYNAFGPDGQMATRQLTRTEADTMSTVSTARTRPPGRSGWEKPDQRKTERPTPLYVEEEAAYHGKRHDRLDQMDQLGMGMPGTLSDEDDDGDSDSGSGSGDGFADDED